MPRSNMDIIEKAASRELARRVRRAHGKQVRGIHFAIYRRTRAAIRTNRILNAEFYASLRNGI